VFSSSLAGVKQRPRRPTSDLTGGIELLIEMRQRWPISRADPDPSDLPASHDREFLCLVVAPDVAFKHLRVRAEHWAGLVWRAGDVKSPKTTDPCSPNRTPQTNQISSEIPYGRPRLSMEVSFPFCDQYLKNGIQERWIAYTMSFWSWFISKYCDI
jgi:hypothetical protein